MLTHQLPLRMAALALAALLAGCVPKLAATASPANTTVPTVAMSTRTPGLTRAPIEPTPTVPAVMASTLAPTQAATDVAVPELRPGAYVEMVYHAKLGQVVLVNGGPERGKPASDPVELWGWDGAVWRLLSASGEGPRWRNGMSVTYDAARGQLVLFGGSQGRRELHDMWLWDGAVWTEVGGDLPPYMGNTGIAYDARRERVVLFGGSDARYNLLAETWEWNGAAWALVSTDGPAPRFPAAMTYDVGRGEVLLYGGHSPSVNGDFRNWGDTWGWDGTAWHAYGAPESLPGIRVLSRAEYDSNLDRVLLFGGVPDDDRAGPLGDLWAWDGAAWTLLDVAAPPARELHAMAYDAGRGVMVLFGGFAAPPYLGTPPLTDTWEWDGTAWRCVSGCVE